MPRKTKIIRRFGGKNFQLSSEHRLKPIAKNEAKRQRRIGLLARVVPSPKGYAVYVRYT